MSAIKNGGPAFPMPIAGCSDGSVYNTLEQSSGELGGMSLRDYFAAKTMQAMYCNSHWHGADRNDIASDAYDQADAMLRARELAP